MLTSTSHSNICITKPRGFEDTECDSGCSDLLKIFKSVEIGDKIQSGLKSYRQWCDEIRDIIRILQYLLERKKSSARGDELRK